MRTVMATALALTLGSFALTGCAAPSPNTPQEAVTFQTRSVPMVGGFCSYFVESQPGKPCLDGMDQVFAAYPALADIGDSDQLIEVTATVSQTVQQRSNAANPPQQTTVSVWVIEKVYFAAQVS